MELTLLVGLGALLLVVLAQLLRQGAGAEPVEIDDLELPAFDIVDRIFDARDHRFVESRKDKRLSREFARRRRNLAYLWLRSVRAVSSRAWRSHLARARQANDLRPVSELRLLLKYLSVHALCAGVTLAIALAGPAGAARLVSTTQRLAEGLATGAGAPLESAPSAAR